MATAKPMKLILSTRNGHKVGEIRELLPTDFQFWTLADFPGAPQVVEDARTFAGNASKKAVELAEWLADRPEVRDSNAPSADAGVYVLADDSGLEVDALAGEPGVHSARFAALDSGDSGNSPDRDNNDKLLRLLQEIPWEKRTARFRCVIALAPVPRLSPKNGSPVCSLRETELLVELFDGACEGRIGFAPEGTAGFGYDPLFIPEGFEQTFAELGADEKNQISHRAKALEKLRKRFRSG